MKPTLTAKDCIAILDKEIAWCEEYNYTIPKRDAEWFIAGLKQAKFLIRLAEASIGDEE